MVPKTTFGHGICKLFSLKVKIWGGGLKRNDFDSNETKVALEKAVSTAIQKRVLLLG